MARARDSVGWFVLGGAGLTFLTPFVLLFTVLFMVYRILTWPFRLVRGWLRHTTA